MTKFNQTTPYEVRRAHFIERAKALWGDKYDYSDLEYTNGKEPCFITCPKHGRFRVGMAQNHILKNPQLRTGCPYCGDHADNDRRLSAERRAKREEERKRRKAKREEERKRRKAEREAERKKGGTGRHKYKAATTLDYRKQYLADRGVNVEGLTDVLINQRFASKKGEEALALVREAKKEERLRKQKEKQELRDREWQQHLQRRTEQVIAMAKAVHGDKYDYSQTKYVRKMHNGKMYYMLTDIRCPIHGLFETRYEVHTRQGCGCPRCFGSGSNLSSEERGRIFIEKSKKNFPDMFAYDKVKYVNKNTPVTLYCKRCHIYFQTSPDTHLGGKGGCPMCGGSVGEVEIYRWLYNNNVEFEREKIIRNPNRQLPQKTLRIDFYVPSLDLYIEMNGEQHYENIPFFSKRVYANGKYIPWNLDMQRMRDCTLRQWCKDNNHRLLEIKYTQVDNIPQILSRAIKGV